MLELLRDLADALEKHSGGLIAIDDGINVTQGAVWETRVCIGWPQNGNVSRLREIIKDNERIIYSNPDESNKLDEPIGLKKLREKIQDLDGDFNGFAWDNGEGSAGWNKAISEVLKLIPSTAEKEGHPK